MKTLYKFPITIIIIVSSGSSSSSSSSSCSNPQPVRIVPEEDIYVELFCVLFLVSVFVLSCVRDRTCEAGREREREREGWEGGVVVVVLIVCFSAAHIFPTVPLHSPVSAIRWFLRRMQFPMWTTLFYCCFLFVCLFVFKCKCFMCTQRTHQWISAFPCWMH